MRRRRGIAPSIWNWRFPLADVCSARMSDEPTDAERIVGALIAQLHVEGVLPADAIDEMARRLPDELGEAVRGYAVEGLAAPGQRVKPQLRAVD